MENRYIVILFIMILFSNFGSGQVSTRISSTQTYELSVIQVFPDSFPIVEIVFQAKNHSGQPLWNLHESDLRVFENDNQCTILNLDNINEKQSINIALVIDHSSSMLFTMDHDSISNHPLNYLYSDSTKKPIDFAIEGATAFVENVNLQLDSVAIIGFATEVDSVIGPTQSKSSLTLSLDSINPGGSTAFFDAISAAMSSITKAKSTKSVIVALTDGIDNSSHKDLNTVISEARSAKTPVYIIGLGNVNDSILSVLADSTDGLYYKTNDPSRLTDLYLQIGRQIKSIYKLQYESQISSVAPSEHIIRFEFANDSMLFTENIISLSLPQEAQDYINDREKQLAQNLKRKRLVLGGVTLGIIILGATTFVLRRNNKEQPFSIISVFPNPFQSEFTVEFENTIDGEFLNMEIISLNGFPLKRRNLEVNNSKCNMNATKLFRGEYILIAKRKNGSTASFKITKSS